MRMTIVTLLAAGTLFAASQSAFAQRGTIQLPVTSNFGVSTTVSVPDRGRAHLGSVSRAGDSRKSYGPFGRGSSRGSFRNHTSSSVGVTIHDFEEMDRRALGQGRDVPVGRRLDTAAENAYRSLLARHARTAGAHDSGEMRQSSGTERSLSASKLRRRDTTETSRMVPTRTASESGHALKFLAEGLRAEHRGALSLAKNYYRVAAKLGSATARRRHAILVEKQSANVVRR